MQGIHLFSPSTLTQLRSQKGQFSENKPGLGTLHQVDEVVKGQSIRLLSPSGYIYLDSIAGSRVMQGLDEIDKFAQTM